MDDNDQTWDDYVDGAVFTINTNESNTTKYSPFFLMFGRNPRLPFEIEKLEQPLTDSESLTQVMQGLSSEEAIRERVDEISRIKDTLFPRVDENIKGAQEKQKQQYKKKKGQPVCPFKVGDFVLQRNMLQKTKAGYKYEDQWLGPYKIYFINADKSTCRLENGSGKKLTKMVSLKQIKPYRSPSNSGSPCTSSNIQPSSKSKAQTPPVPKPRNKVPFRTPPVPKPRGKIPVPNAPVPKPRTKHPSTPANTVTFGGNIANEAPPPHASPPAAGQKSQKKPSSSQSATSAASTKPKKNTKVTIRII